MYICIFCGYSNEKKNNYLRHLKTKRHLENFNKMNNYENNFYNCSICKYKNKKRSNYLRHINLCVMKNLNKSISINSKDDITQLQNKYKSEIRNLHSLIKKERKKNNLCLKIIENLIEENIINYKIFNNKNILSLNEKKKIFEYLHEKINNDSQNSNTKENILNKIENHTTGNVTIYLNNINNDKENNDKENNESEHNEGNENNKIDESIEDTDSEDNNSLSTNSDCSSSDYSDSCDEVELLIDKKISNLKKIRDCGRIYYYDEKNNVYNNNKIIGIRKHDESCPRNHCNNNYNDKCWWYVEYL
jgi:hypothetical protein